MKNIANKSEGKALQASFECKGKTVISLYKKKQHDTRLKKRREFHSLPDKLSLPIQQIRRQKKLTTWHVPRKSSPGGTRWSGQRLRRKP